MPSITARRMAYRSTGPGANQPTVWRGPSDGSDLAGGGLTRRNPVARRTTDSTTSITMAAPAPVRPSSSASAPESPFTSPMTPKKK